MILDLDDGDDVSADASIIIDINRFIHSIVSPLDIIL
jgi:hypothetical protein